MPSTNIKSKALMNLKKSKGMINKISEMIEKDEYCIDIIQQNLAAIGLLKSTHQILLNNHLDECFRKVVSSHNKKQQQEMLDEILRVSKICHNTCSR